MEGGRSTTTWRGAGRRAVGMDKVEKVGGSRGVKRRTPGASSPQAPGVAASRPFAHFAATLASTFVIVNESSVATARTGEPFSPMFDRWTTPLDCGALSEF